MREPFSMETKLTVRVPEELRRRAQERAATEGTTLSRIIRERLEEFVAGWDAAEEAEDVRVADEAEARLARGEERLLEWSEVDAELEALPD
jgi:predicted DNA-binding protein